MFRRVYYDKEAASLELKNVLPLIMKFDCKVYAQSSYH